MPSRLLIWTIVLAGTASLCCQAPGDHDKASPSERPSETHCASQTESFPLRRQDLTVANTDGAILFTAGMTIDADGAPNAYGPHNRGLDYNANARDSQGWVALVTDDDGRPVIQKSGRYRGYYVSTTSLEQRNVRDQRNPKRYIDATKIPYIALPQDFAQTFDIQLGDLAVVVNQANGRSAYAIYADVGPKGKIGEGSVALAKALGMPANPRHDSVASGITYLIFPRSALRPGDRATARNIQRSAARLYRQWGGGQKLRTCEVAISTQQPAFSH